jgi:hypothetical protein
VHKTSYQMFRGVRGGTKCNRSQHCLQCVKEVVGCRNFNNVRVCPGPRGSEDPDLSSDEPFPDSEVQEYLCTYSTIQGIKKLSLVNRIFVQKRQYCQKESEVC